MEVAGAKRTGGLGFAALDSIAVGGVALPVHSVSVLDLRGATGGADGVLGYPFFASAEVTIDPLARTMTFAKPGTLQPKGTEFSFDNDRQLVDAATKVMEEIHHAAGAEEAITINRYAHLVGGCRMGASERDGVVDADLRSFAIPNLFVTDGSVLPTQGSANPALTIMALAARAADRMSGAA